MMKKLMLIPAGLLLLCSAHSSYAQGPNQESFFASTVNGILSEIRDNLHIFHKHFLTANNMCLPGDTRCQNNQPPTPRQTELNEKLKKVLLQAQKNNDLLANQNTLNTLKTYTLTLELDDETCKAYPSGPKACNNPLSVKNIQKRLNGAVPSSLPDYSYGKTAASIKMKDNDNAYAAAKKKSITANNSLNFNSLLEPQVYPSLAEPQKPDNNTGSEEKPTSVPIVRADANNVITLIATQGEPTPIPTQIKGSESDQVAGIAKIKAYIAQRSVGLSNLNQILQRRIKTTIGKSQLEQEFTSASRWADPEWNRKMSQATSLELQRETLQLLAQMNYQMYQARRDQERLLATVSAMQLQVLQFLAKSALATAQIGKGEGE